MRSTARDFTHVICSTLGGRHGHNKHPILMKFCTSASYDLTKRLIYCHFFEFVTRAEIGFFFNLNALPERQREREQELAKANVNESRVLWVRNQPSLSVFLPFSPLVKEYFICVRLLH